MKKDISFAPVDKVYVAIVPEKTELDETIWNAWLINTNDVKLTNVFVTSKGYSTEGNQKQETSVLRQHFPELEPNQHVQIELVNPAVFRLANEYWVSYYIGQQIFDKKFIFMPETIIEDNLIFIPQLNQKGILHS
ncbi:hypothetical protein RCC89_01125 [Cytophagaceae bacterium ABcell3]|nr:hypothetical protein RCC89_01125 [Cytophagaceae bacterium ABcell3]